MSDDDQDWRGPDDFEDEYDGDGGDDLDDWTEEQWEAYLQERDERTRRMMELLDRYGHDEAGFRRAMEELGFGEIFEELDRREAEQRDEIEPEEETESEEEKIDRILFESRLANETLDEPGYRDPLGQSAYELTMMILKSTKGRDDIDSPDHPLVVFARPYLDAQGGLARMGYMRQWDDEHSIALPRNLKIVELKRVIKNYVIGLGQLEHVAMKNLLPAEVCAPIRLHTIDLLDQVRAELRQLRRK